MLRLHLAEEEARAQEAMASCADLVRVVKADASEEAQRRERKPEPEPKP